MSGLGRELIGMLDADDAGGLLRGIVDIAPADDVAALADLLRPLLGSHIEQAWFSTTAAAKYLGLATANALQKIANRGEIEYWQDCPGGMMWFRRRWLDDYRRGIRPRNRAL